MFWKKKTDGVASPAPAARPPTTVPIQGGPQPPTDPPPPSETPMTPPPPGDAVPRMPSPPEGLSTPPAPQEAPPPEMPLPPGGTPLSEDIPLPRSPPPPQSPPPPSPPRSPPTESVHSEPQEAPAAPEQGSDPEEGTDDAQLEEEVESSKTPGSGDDESATEKGDEETKGGDRDGEAAPLTAGLKKLSTNNNGPPELNGKTKLSYHSEVQYYGIKVRPEVVMKNPVVDAVVRLAFLPKRPPDVHVTLRHVGKQVMGISEEDVQVLDALFDRIGSEVEVRMDYLAVTKGSSNGAVISVSFSDPEIAKLCTNTYPHITIAYQNKAKHSQEWVGNALKHLSRTLTTPQLKVSESLRDASPSTLLFDLGGTVVTGVVKAWP